MTRPALLLFVLALLAMPLARAQAPSAPPADPAPEKKETSWWDRDWAPCDKMWDWAAYQCRGVKDAWHNGTPTVYFSGYAWHDRNTYTEEKIESFQERAWGGGYGITKVNDQGDSFGWYGLIFRDSHNNYTKMFGWGAMTYWPKQSDFAAGLGYTIFIASRPDIYSNIPFPGILPLVSVKVSRAEIFGTFIPNVGGGVNNGNVAFVFGRYHF